MSHILREPVFRFLRLFKISSCASGQYEFFFLWSLVSIGISSRQEKLYCTDAPADLILAIHTLWNNPRYDPHIMTHKSRLRLAFSLYPKLWDWVVVAYAAFVISKLLYILVYFAFWTLFMQITCGYLIWKVAMPRRSVTSFQGHFWREATSRHGNWKLYILWITRSWKKVTGTVWIWACWKPS